MDFASAFSSLTDGRATKCPTWGGYLKREDYLASGSDPAGAYYGLVTRVGDMYVFKVPTGGSSECLGKDPHSSTQIGSSGIFELGADTIAEAITSSDFSTGTNPTLNDQLFDNFGTTDWILDSASTYEAARTSGSLTY